MQMFIRLAALAMVSVAGLSASAQEAPLCYCPPEADPDALSSVTLYLHGTGQVSLPLSEVVAITDAGWLNDIYWPDPDVRELVAVRDIGIYGEYLLEFSRLPKEQQCMLADVVDTAWNAGEDSVPPPAFSCP